MQRFLAGGASLPGYIYRNPVFNLSLKISIFFHLTFPYAIERSEDIRMATKPPSPVKSYPEDSIEAKAYKSVADIPTREPNDRVRLGYHVWRWLKLDGSSTLQEHIAVSGARLLVDPDEAKETILAKLKELGVHHPTS